MIMIVLLGKLSSGDMDAIEAKYHLTCLLDLYRKASRVERSQFPRCYSV